MQSKRMSVVESVASTAIGYVVAVVAQLFILPLFDLPVSLTESALMGLFFTVISVVRSYIVRRFFNSLKDTA